MASFTRYIAVICLLMSIFALGANADDGRQDLENFKAFARERFNDDERFNVFKQPITVNVEFGATPERIEWVDSSIQRLHRLTGLDFRPEEGKISINLSFIDATGADFLYGAYQRYRDSQILKHRISKDEFDDLLEAEFQALKSGEVDDPLVVGFTATDESGIRRFSNYFIGSGDEDASVSTDELVYRILVDTLFSPSGGNPTRNLDCPFRRAESGIVCGNAFEMTAYERLAAIAMYDPSMKPGGGVEDLINVVAKLLETKDP